MNPTARKIRTNQSCENKETTSCYLCSFQGGEQAVVMWQYSVILPRYSTSKTPYFAADWGARTKFQHSKGRLPAACFAKIDVGGFRCRWP